MIVAIQPAYGDAWTRAQFAATLERQVAFASAGHRQHLSLTELAALTEAHPEGLAACWGGTRSQEAKLRTLQRGDVMLLTGQRHLQGAGRLATMIDNPEFARALWGSHPRRCSFEVVYSLCDFQRLEVPYAALQAALGTSERDNFQGLRLVRDRQRVDAVLDLLDAS